MSDRGAVLPERLYHYTDQNGLLGILTHQTIWATQVQYLNDGSELELGFDLTRKYLRNHPHFERNNLQGRALRTFEAYIERVADPAVFVASFSEVPDLLSQWRGYTSPGNGFVIGFQPGSVLPPEPPPFWKLVRCQYREAEQLQTIVRHVDQHLRRLKSARDNFPSEDEVDRLNSSGFEFVSELMTLAPAIKHVSFSEEREWRLVSHVIRVQNRSVGFRPGRHSLIPYYNWPLSNLENSVTNIVVGPGQHPDLSRNAVGGLLRKFSLPGEVTVSKVPFRDW